MIVRTIEFRAFVRSKRYFSPSAKDAHLGSFANCLTASHEHVQLHALCMVAYLPGWEQGRERGRGDEIRSLNTFRHLARP